MSLTLVLFLFLCHLGIGTVLTMALISSGAGVRFFRFTSALAFIFLVLGLTLHPAALTFTRDAQGVGCVSLLVTMGALSFVVAPTNPWRRKLLWLSAVAGLATLVAQAVAATTTVPLALTVFSFLTAAALMGSSFTAMILGHWFLVLPTLDVTLLQSVVKFHLWSVVARAVAVAAVAWAAALAWDPRVAPSFGAYLLSIDGVFFWQRVLFGLVGPAVLAYMTWETAKIRSTQSATGILYVDFFTVIIGGLVAKYVLLATALPF
jgi:hypothetical protein